MISCGEDRQLVLWKISDKEYKPVQTVKDTHFRAIYSVSWKDNFIASAGGDNQINVYKVEGLDAEPNI